MRFYSFRAYLTTWIQVIFSISSNFFMTNIYTYLKFITQSKESIEDESTNIVALQAPCRSNLLLFTTLIAATILFAGTTTTYQRQNIDENAHVLSDTDCLSAELTSNQRQHFIETNDFVSTKKTPNTTAQMGFSLSGIWDFLVTTFSTRRTDEHEDVELSEELPIGCNCQEYLYLNDVDGGSVHKFIVEDDGSLTEIFTNGGSWYPGTNTTELPRPHGLSIDINGFLYIGERSEGDIRKLNCNGEILPESEFEITGVGGFNFGNIGDMVFTNDLAVRDEVEVFNICEGAPMGSICFQNQTYNWGLYVDTRDSTIYATSAFGTRAIYKATLADINSGTCVAPFLSAGNNNLPAIGDNFLPSASTTNIQGITTDKLGNIYVVLGQAFAMGPRQLYKYSPTGILLAKSIIDNDGGDGSQGKFTFATGISYSDDTDLIYTSNITSSSVEDCISIFDTDLNYVGTGFPNPPGANGSQLAKGIGIIKECCPTNNNTTIDTLICGASINDALFLQNLIGCEGPICEGIWQEGIGNTGMTYNDCDNSVTLSNSTGCGTFTKSSNGLAGQCGAFDITVNICFSVELTAPEIAVTDNNCGANTPGAFTVTTACEAGSTIEWSTDNGTTWNTTVPIYDTANAQTVVARCVSDVDNACLSAVSAAVTSNPSSCCPTPNCFDISTQQN